MAQKQKPKKRNSTYANSKRRSSVNSKTKFWISVAVVMAILFLIAFCWLLIDAGKFSRPQNVVEQASSKNTKPIATASPETSSPDAAHNSYSSQPDVPQTLAEALDRWIASGVNGGGLTFYTDHVPRDVATPTDARAVCDALDALYNEPKRNRSDFVSTLNRLLVYFQNVSSQPAYSVLKRDGLPRLRKWAHDADQGKHHDVGDLLLILKILAAYKCEEDVQLIADAALRRGADHPYMWDVVFSIFNSEHPYAVDLVDALRDPMPQGVRLSAFLTLCTDLVYEKKIEDHPFNATDGRSHLRDLLADQENEFGSAEDAAMAIPFLEEQHRGELLKLAEAHQDVDVRIKAAWADAKSGNESGIERLKKFSLDVHNNYMALFHMRNLDLDEEIPAAASEESFLAIAEMSFWLQHPNEFDRVPTKIELYDQRELFWPPVNEKRKVYLIKFAFDAKDEDSEPSAGVGMVGSRTFALRDETENLSPEDIYGLHCCWELMRNGAENAPEERTAEAGRKILAEHNEGF